MKTIPIHTVKHMWEAYSRKILAENPEFFSRRHNKIKNFYIYRGHTDDPIPVVSYTKFRKIIEDYFDRAKTAIIKGEAIDMRGGLGKICAKRVERDFTSRKQRNMVDWKRTEKYKVWDEEKEKFIYTKIIYYANDDWSRICWFRNGMVKNELMYEFKPSGNSSKGINGFRGEFSQALRNDPLLKYRYLYHSVVHPFINPKAIKE
jgi:hypothetical protein